MSNLKYSFIDQGELEEILACLQDSDRYIIEGRKDRLIKEIVLRVGIVHQ